MCGIFGINAPSHSGLSDKKISEIVKTLFVLSESRGKEAAGIAAVDEHHINIFKSPETASRLVKTPTFTGILQSALSASQPCVTILGHSRLVTNGEEHVSANNQPVCRDHAVAVHNGIVVNVDALWAAHPDKTRTCALDSEVLLMLFQHHYHNQQCVQKALRFLFTDVYGMTSLAMLFAEHDNLLLTTNNGSLYYMRCSADVLIFASERVILKNLIRKCDLQQSFVPDSITQLAPNSAALVSITSGAVTTFPINQNNTQTDVSTLTRSALTRQIHISSPANDSTSVEKAIRKSNVKILVPSDITRHFDLCEKAVSLLKRCTKCVLPETFPFIDYDHDGVCNYCRNHQTQQIEGREALEQQLSRYRTSGAAPNCLVTFSGGRDSSYGLHLVKKELGLNPIAYSYDWGMITDLARRNQARLCGKLGVEHILVSADIRQKRKNIRLNVLAWLKRPDLGTVPLFMAGDKQYFHHANRLAQENSLDLIILCENMLETTKFKSGFCGVRPRFDAEHTYTLAFIDKARMMLHYAKQLMLNPAYLNTSLLDTADAFRSYYALPHDYLNIYRYIPWHETVIEDTLRNEYDWELASDTTSTWRIGDGTAPFYNYIYYILAGFTENETFRSNQIREGMISRDDALNFCIRDNTPRYESIQWYCDTIGIDRETTLRRIHAAAKLYVMAA